MEQNYGITMPPKMREAFGYHVKSVSDHAHKELQPSEVYDVFKENYLNKCDKFTVSEAHFSQKNGISSNVTVTYNGTVITREAQGNGRLDAVSNAVKDALNIKYSISVYEEHALERGSSSQACAYVGIDTENGTFWGAGIHTDIIDASIKALVSAINNSGLVK
jgi:2-isopropylmalate synthase